MWNQFSEIVDAWFGVAALTSESSLFCCFLRLPGSALLLSFIFIYFFLSFVSTGSILFSYDYIPAVSAQCRVLYELFWKKAHSAGFHQSLPPGSTRSPLRVGVPCTWWKILSAPRSLPGHQDTTWKAIYNPDNYNQTVLKWLLEMCISENCLIIQLQWVYSCL